MYYYQCVTHTMVSIIYFVCHQICQNLEFIKKSIYIDFVTLRHHIESTGYLPVLWRCSTLQLILTAMKQCRWLMSSKDEVTKEWILSMFSKFQSIFSITNSLWLWVFLDHAHCIIVLCYAAFISSLSLVRTFCRTTTLMYFDVLLSFPVLDAII